MKNRKGQTFVEWLVVIGIIGILFAAVFCVLNKYVVGNKQFVDLKQNFNVAYVLTDDSKFERINVKAWKDWKDSDAIQVISDDGKVIYTHLRNVKLCSEK